MTNQSIRHSKAISQTKHINQPDNRGWTALHWACFDKNIPDFDMDARKKPIVKALLENEKIDLLAKDNNSQTPLHIACLFGNPTVIKMLAKKLDENAITLADKYSYTPMDLAIGSGKIGNVQAMIDIYEEKKIGAVPKKLY